MKENVKSVVVLTAICLVVAALLAVTNFYTAPIIEANKAAAATGSLAEVIPGCKRHNLADKLFFALFAGCKQTGVNKSIESVGDSVFEGFGRISDACNGVDSAQSGILTHISCGIIRAEVLGFLIVCKQNAGNLAVRAKADGDCHGACAVI